MDDPFPSAFTVSDRDGPPEVEARLDRVRPVRLHSHQVPLADGWDCTCGRPVRYNMTAGLIFHADDETPCRGALDKPMGMNLP